MTSSPEPISENTTDNDASAVSPPAPGIDRRGGLTSRSFIGLLVTQFLGATNDNMFRWLVVPIGKDMVGPEHTATALSVGLACFVLPYILLAAPAGYLADRFSKRRVIVSCKVAEIIVMSLGIAAIAIGNMYLMFTVVALMGAQSALFGPSKLGSIPEIVHDRCISAANALVGLTTVVAIVLGTVAGNLLYSVTKPLGTNHLWLSAIALLGVAVSGWFASIHIMRLVPANPGRLFPFNFPAQTVRDLRTLASSRSLLRAALGTAFFWALAALAQVNVDTYAINILGVGQSYVGPLLAVLAVGVGAGSVLAGIWSAGRVELGIVPIGAATIAFSSMLLFGVPSPSSVSLFDAYGLTCVCLFMLGIGAGLFDVPLQAFLQQRSPDQSRGVVLAATNFLTFSGMLISAGLFWFFSNVLHLSARQVFLVAGLATLPVFVYIVWLLPSATVRFLVWLLSRTIYRVRVKNMEVLPEKGGALLVANHVSWIDGILLIITSSRPIRMIVWDDYIKGWWISWLAREMQAIPISASRKSVIHAVRAAREGLKDGDLVCIFPEGHLTRSGKMEDFKPGFLSIIKGTGAPVIPICLHGLWGSIFSYERGKFFWKWPRQWPYPVSILFGKPIDQPQNIQEVRGAVETLYRKAVNMDEYSKLIPARRFLRNCRRSMGRSKVADSTGADITGGELLTRTLVLRRLLCKHVLADDEKNVGILLPPTVAGTIVNAAMAVDGRVAVNLNYSVKSPEIINDCISQAGIRHVITSRRVMDKLDMDLDAEMVYLEDLREKLTMADKLIGLAQARLVPVRLLERSLGLTRIEHDDLLTLIFTSGSTGMPKGVMLTHRNIGSNVDAFAQSLRLSKDDTLLGILPFFHSFGYTVTLWAPLIIEPKVAYHHNPLEARPIGNLARKHGATILLATPTFLRSFIRRIDKEDFKLIDTVVTGAEKLPKDVSDAFEDKFGVRPSEGYGTTELSPAVSCNVPPCRMTQADQLVSREGSIGLTFPGISAKIIDLDTDEDLGTNRAGMLLVTGPNVMKGYLHKPELTAEVMRDGWYVTGDMAKIDDDGFIFITGRISRFSKIGGEMVPHIGVEEAIVEAVGLDAEELCIAVTSIPDASKGERLIVLYTSLPCEPAEICQKLRATGLPAIWVPSPDAFRQVDEIPVLGTGKLALKEIKDMAMGIAAE